MATEAPDPPRNGNSHLKMAFLYEIAQCFSLTRSTVSAMTSSESPDDREAGRLLLVLGRRSQIPSSPGGSTHLPGVGPSRSAAWQEDSHDPGCAQPGIGYSKTTFRPAALVGNAAEIVAARTPDGPLPQRLVKAHRKYRGDVGTEGSSSGERCSCMRNWMQWCAGSRHHVQLRSRMDRSNATKSILHTGVIHEAILTFGRTLPSGVCNDRQWQSPIQKCESDQPWCVGWLHCTRSRRALGTRVSAWTQPNWKYVTGSSCRSLNTPQCAVKKFEVDVRNCALPA